MTQETFKGLTIQSKVTKPEHGSDHYNQLSWAIEQWMKASVGTGQNQIQCENASRELQIERDHGFIVHINRRIESPKRS